MTSSWHKIIEAAEAPGNRVALTIEWLDGSETVELVSEQAAKILGYEFEVEE